MLPDPLTCDCGSTFFYEARRYQLLNGVQPLPLTPDNIPTIVCSNCGAKFEITTEGLRPSIAR